MTNNTDPLSVFEGAWHGKNLLRLSWLDPSEFLSDTTCVVTKVVADNFLSFRYTWAYKGEDQNGLLMMGLNNSDSSITAAWADSWHQKTGLMEFKGKLTADGNLDLRGSYPAPPGPDWGWRIVVEPHKSKEMRLVMYNITPDGVEDLAVKAEYVHT